VEAKACQNGEGTKDGILNRPFNGISDIPFKRILDMLVKNILNEPVDCIISVRRGKWKYQ
jgi:hypothetical protein